MNEKLQIVFGLLGGLAVFLYGMNMMSECLQKAAGEKMKKILSLLTRNPLLGVLAGALTTAVLQSSSATTVMAIGFVSAGLMTLPQAISIILGANIGTTMTAQIIAFKLSDYIYIIIFAGFIVSFICKSERIKNIGKTIFAFGLLFLGIETMGSVMKPLAASPVFTDLIEKVADVPLLGVVVGTFMTLIVQSSSATIAVLQNFATQAGPDGVTSIIGLTGAIPILLGDNIGTTITALLASIGQSKDAKRTAVAHCIFNISGCLLFIGLIKPYAYLIQLISPKGSEVDVISRQIANAHTGFNLTMTILWIPLIWLMVKIVMKIIPEKNSKYTLKPAEPQYLEDRLLNQPVVALNLVSKEILRCGDMVKEMLDKVKSTANKDNNASYDEIIELGDTIHVLNNKINDYLSRLFSKGVIAAEQSSQAVAIMYVLCDIDRMGTLCKEITENVKNKTSGKKKYSKEAIKDLKKSVGFIDTMYSEALETIKTGKDTNIENILKNRESIMQLDEKMRKAHMERVGKGKCDAGMTTDYNSLLHNIDRMCNSCVNIADTAVNQVDYNIFTSLEEEENIPSMV